MRSDRIKRLEAAGMVWEPQQVAWEEGYEHFMATSPDAQACAKHGRGVGHICDGNRSVMDRSGAGGGICVNGEARGRGIGYGSIGEGSPAGQGAVRSLKKGPNKGGEAPQQSDPRARDQKWNIASNRGF